MQRVHVFVILFVLFIGYSFLVYTSGTIGKEVAMSNKAINGKNLFQKHNCTSCHQIYGLGGYLGSELTTTISQPGKGPNYAKSFLQTGTQRMPNFHLTNMEQQDLVEYLTYVDQTAITYKNKSR